MTNSSFYSSGFSDHDLTCHQSLILDAPMGSLAGVDRFVTLVPDSASPIGSAPSADSVLSSPTDDASGESFQSKNQRNRRVHFSVSFTSLSPTAAVTAELPPLQPSRSLSLPTTTPKIRLPGRCRLIGFTPLNEASVPELPPISATQFLGPRQVKAKEVAPCALLYKRADIFVSSEMKAQNLVSYCNSHYENMRFEEETLSTNDLGHSSDLPSPISQSDDSASHIADHSGETRQTTCGGTSNDEEGIPARIEPEAFDAVQEALGHLFVSDGLTSIPHFDSTLSFYPDQFDEPLEDLDGVALAGLSPAEFSEAAFSPNEVEDLTENLSFVTSSGTSSSGIQSNLWEASTSASTRATSPVSSLYSNISSSCYHAPLTSAQLKHPDFQTNLCNGTKLGNTHRWTRSHNGLRSRRSRSSCGETLPKSENFLKASSLRFHQNHPTFEGYDHQFGDDQGSLADDEGDKNSSNSQILDSDDDQGWTNPFSCSKSSASSSDFSFSNPASKDGKTVALPASR